MSETENASSTTELQKASDKLQAIRDQVTRVMVGQAAVIEQVLIAFMAGGHVLIEGVPGLGKTLLVKALARSFDGRFARIQFTPDLMPSDVTGHAVFDMKTEEFKIRRGPVFTQVLLADEINRAPAKTQSALLEVMQENQVTIEGESHRLTPPFITLATQNPLEQEGTYPLPEAQLDRFLFKVLIDYPDANEEHQLVARASATQGYTDLDLGQIQTVATPADVIAMQEATRGVTVDERIVHYAVRIARATRDWHGVTVGAGPRAGISMINAARARALLDGRDFVIPDDIKYVALPCLRHRIRVSPELAIEGTGPDHVINALLGRVEAPRQ
jgi:MoxR-like ATPase